MLTSGPPGGRTGVVLSTAGASTSPGTRRASVSDSRWGTKPHLDGRLITGPGKQASALHQVARDSASIKTCSASAGWAGEAPRLIIPWNGVRSFSKRTVTAPVRSTCTEQLRSDHVGAITHV